MLTRKLGRKKAHRSHMLRNLAGSVILHETVETTEAKAKEVKKLIDRVITIAKKNNLASRRKLIGLFFDQSVVEKLINDLVPRYSDRLSGYSQTVRTGIRRGDGMNSMRITLIKKTPVKVESELDNVKNN